MRFVRRAGSKGDPERQEGNWCRRQDLNLKAEGRHDVLRGGLQGPARAGRAEEMRDLRHAGRGRAGVG